MTTDPAIADLQAAARIRLGAAIPVDTEIARRIRDARARARSGAAAQAVAERSLVLAGALS